MSDARNYKNIGHMYFLIKPLQSCLDNGGVPNPEQMSEGEETFANNSSHPSAKRHPAHC